jgi:hypothetical protein
MSVRRGRMRAEGFDLRLMRPRFDVPGVAVKRHGGRLTRRCTPLQRAADSRSPSALLRASKTSNTARRNATVPKLVGAAMMVPKEYKKVISLGPSCETALQIREVIDQDEAYVFDWVIAPPGVVAAVLEEDFSTLLYPDNLSFVPRGDGVENAHVYDTGSGLEFHHDFRNAPEFMEGYENAAGKYAFLINRFRSRMSDGPILFIQHQADHANAQRLESAIATRYPNLPFRLLVIGTAGVPHDWPAEGGEARLFRVDIPGSGHTWQERTPQWRAVLVPILKQSFASGLLVLRRDTKGVEAGAATLDSLEPTRRSASWIDRRRWELVDTFQRLAGKERLMITQPFFPFDGQVDGCDIIWADDQHLRTHPDFTCDIFFSHGYSPDFSRIAYVRETGRATLVANWFWDNHHLFASSMHAAMLSDINFHAHDYASSYLANELAETGGFAPLCPIFWTQAVVQQAATLSLLAERSDNLYGGYNSYPEFPARDIALSRIMEGLPQHNIFITPHGTSPDQHPFYGMSPLARLQEWMKYKVSLCMSFGANTAIRIFDCLLAGGIPLIVGRPADLDQIFSAQDMESLPVIVVETDDPIEVRRAYQLCLQRFDHDGPEGVMRRWQFTRSNHMPANRMASMVTRIRQLAANSDALLARA